MKVASSHRVRRVRRVAAGVAAAVLLSGCATAADDGAEPTTPTPGATTAPILTETTSPTASAAPSETATPA